MSNHIDETLALIGREKNLFDQDITALQKNIDNIVSNSKFLVLGGGGSIGQAVSNEIFSRNPKILHVVDISENNLVELVRDLRSSYGYIDGEFKTFALDINSVEFDAFIASSSGYDYVLNLSALKHVRSEKDPYTLMRMIQVNIFNTIKTIQQSIDLGAKKYFCVSTDKAANPINMMGASKRIMEMFLMQSGNDINISTARFANVAFSDGSLLHGFNQRILKNQPIVAPSDIKRYFITPKESGELCLISCLFGENRDIFFPKLSESLHLITFADIALNFLQKRGYEPLICTSENEARGATGMIKETGKWPCLFMKSDTTGEKDFEEFYTQNEILDNNKYINFGIIKSDLSFDPNLLLFFEKEIAKLLNNKSWDKKQIVNIFKIMIPSFEHQELDKFLDEKM
jgi:FlaA1/EpsC-like NDP-sugar epimerase